MRRRHITIASVPHTGTTFLRLLLELHPATSGWKKANTIADRRPLGAWRLEHAAGRITYPDLCALYRRAPAGRSAFVAEQLDRLGLQLPPLPPDPVVDLVHLHLPERDTTTGRLAYHVDPAPTITPLRDPLWAIASGLRRGGPPRARQILFGFRHLAATIVPPFYLPLDLPGTRSTGTLARLAYYLDLRPTRDMREYWLRWPRVEPIGRLRRPFDTPEYVAAYQLLQLGEVHPTLRPWARALRRAGLVDFCRRHGYLDLPWFREANAA